MKTFFALVSVAIMVLLLEFNLITLEAQAQQAPDISQNTTTTQQPIALTPPPLPWLTIYPSDPNDQGFRNPPSRILIGVNTPDALEICIERTGIETRCLTIGTILEYASAVVLTPPPEEQ